MVATAPQTAVRKRRRPARDSDTPTVGRSRTGTVVANAVGVLFAIVMFFPVYWVVNTAFKPAPEILQFEPTFFPHTFTLDNFKSAFNAPFFQQDLLNGVIVTSGAVLGALLVGFLAALAIARFRFYGRKAIILVVLSVQMVPFVAILIPLSYILVLTAMSFTPVSYVAPAREISILIGTALGARLLAEGDARRRLAAASAMVLGIVGLAIG